MQINVWVRFTLFSLFSALILLLQQPASAQQTTSTSTTLQGTIADAQSKEALIQATVSIRGTVHKTTSDENGAFRLITNEKFPYTITVQYMGYKTKEVLVSEDRVAVFLEPDFNQLEDVVVVGYGTQKRTSITGAVGTVKLDQEIAGRPAVEIGQSLYGQLPGVQIISPSGKPGASAAIQVRGVNSVSAGTSPLIVIDGIPTPGYDLNLINNADVESIEVLKDASSSAIYGSRGANGVVLVTTKSGKSGQTKLNVNYVSGIQQVINHLDVMDAAEYAQASIDAAQNGWIESGGDPNAPNTIAARGNYLFTWPQALENPASLPNTDWQDVIFRTAPINKLDLNVTGGGEKTSYLISGGLVKQKGIQLSSDYSKYTLALKTNTKVNNWLEIGSNINLAYDEGTEPFSRMTEWAVQYPAIYPVYSANGYLGSPSNETGFENYNAILFRPQNGHPLYRITDDIRQSRFNSLGTLFAQATILPGLSFKSAINYFYNRTDNKNYQARDHQLGPTFYTEGAMSVDQGRTASYILQNLLNFDRSFGKHNLSALLGTEYNYNDIYRTYQERRGYDNDLVHALSAGRTVFAAEDDIAKTSLISYFARANYGYAGKYLLSLSVRRDGSSRFAPNNKWGYFPAISGGWLISEEPFLKENKVISNLKIRASYGLTGNDRFDDYRWIGTISQERFALGNSLGTSYYPSSITNPNLRWERTKQINLGVDAGFINNRINLTADFYRSKSDGLLLDVPVPEVSGFTSIFKNIGEVENRGLELSLTTYNLTGGDFTWTTSFNIAHNKNKIVSLGPDNAPIIFSGSQFSGMEKINMVGQELFSFYGLQYLGVYKNQAEIDADPASYPSATPGDGRYADLNNDGVINANDRTILGSYNPDFTWGFTSNFTYKGLDLGLVFQGVHGVEIMDDNVHRSMLYHEGRNYNGALVNRWRSESEPGDGYHYKLTTVLDGFEKTPSSYWIFDGSYFRLKSLTVGYTFPKTLTDKIKLSSLRFYVNGQNLFTHKEAPVFDPENFSGEASDASRRGVSSNSFPSAKIYSIGVNVGL